MPGSRRAFHHGLMEVQLTGVVNSDDDFLAWVASGLSGVSTVIAWNAGLTDRGAEALARAAETDSIAYVDLSWNRIGADGAAAFAASKTLERMTRLRLYHNDVGAAGASAIAAAGARFELLNLCGNHLGDAGVGALAAGELAALRELALGWNGLSREAALAVARGPWRELERLNMRANELDAAGVKALLSGSLPRLRWLGVDENPLGDAGLAAILAAPGFGRLEWLNLGGTELDDHAVDQFATVGPCALRELRVHDNELSAGAIARLCAALPGCEVCA